MGIQVGEELPHNLYRGMITIMLTCTVVENTANVTQLPLKLLCLPLIFHALTIAILFFLAVVSIF